MKKCLLPLFVAAAVSCAPVKETLRSGDLIFVGLPSDTQAGEDSMSSAISESTGDGALNLIHVAIAEVADDGVWIIDATLRHGVDRHPLDTFLTDFTRHDGTYPAFLVKRLKDPGRAAECIQKAKAFLGEPYDSVFLADNGAHYCSELVRDSYRSADGGYLFEQQPMNWKNDQGEIPAYWERLFAGMGMAVPQGEPGTNPQEMARSALLRDVDVVLTDYR